MNEREKCYNCGGVMVILKKEPDRKRTLYACTKCKDQMYVHELPNPDLV